jgi:hypothetical protein
MKLEPLLPVAKGQKATYLENWTTLPWKDLAEAVRKNNGGNVGLRLDLYFALDPDCLKAEAFCNELDANGEIPQTVTYQTASGYTVRIFTPPPGRNHKALDIKNGMSLELRHGTGQYCVIPPSYLKKSKTGKPGYYKWMPGHSPDDIEPADFPIELYERLEAMATPPEVAADPVHKPEKRNLNFEQGSRDNSIFSVALALRKGGMNEADLLVTIEALAASCNPPFPLREAARKVQAALKATPAERNLAQEIKEYLECVAGRFSTVDLDRELGITSKVEKTNRRKVLHRLAQDGIIHRDPNNNGFYFKPSDDHEIIDPWQSDELPEYRLIWPRPLNIHDYCYLYSQSLAVVAGAKDAGKTALMLNIAASNPGLRVSYFNSEMAVGELQLRLSKFDLGRESWRHVEWIGNYNSQNVEDIIRPDNLNIIDYLEEPAETWKLGIQISRIRQKLRNGVAIIGLQKDRGKDMARGGESTMQKSRIYLTLDNGEAKLVVGKLWRTPGRNPKNMTWRYKLVDGCKFIGQ